MAGEGKGENAPRTVSLGELLTEHLAGPVRLVLFTSGKTASSAEQQKILETLAGMSDRLSLEVHDVEKDAELAARLGVERAPCTIVTGEHDYRLRFYGVNAGEELSTLLEAILMTGNGRPLLDPTLAAWARRIDEPTHVQVFVTLTCPYCPRVLHTAQQVAAVNEKVRTDMIDVAEFPELHRFGHAGVPFVVVNGRPAFRGTRSPEEVVLEILRVAAPAAFEEVEAQLREASGESRVRPAAPEHVYDAIVVGAGPAAMSAAVYAVRKGLDVLLLGDRLGGQVADTAAVENWLGSGSVGGHDLALLFRAHVENYAVAELLHARVAAVEREGDLFLARLEDGGAFRGRALIYCAGKRYRTLGVPGEAQFLGRGIAFCATCDAPLYRGKRVVVVGGGNSAFTAARDLLAFAAEVHLVNVLPDWQADAVLLAQVRDDPRARLHPATKVVEVLGKEQLAGVKLAPADGGEPRDLAADGVFLEVGLVPNSGPVAALVPLNAQGEVIVGRDQATAVPGFFAAGDVTDEPEKQIVVAAGAGAKAGLAAHAYLAARGRTVAPAP